jgi:hypothetical protein
VLLSEALTAFLDPLGLPVPFPPAPFLLDGAGLLPVRSVPVLAVDGFFPDEDVGGVVLDPLEPLFAPAGREFPLRVDDDPSALAGGRAPDRPAPGLVDGADLEDDPLFWLGRARSPREPSPDPDCFNRGGFSLSAGAGAAPTMPRRNKISWVPIRMALDTIK